jgi:hypothetical protein
LYYTKTQSSIGRTAHPFLKQLKQSDNQVLAANWEDKQEEQIRFFLLKHLFTFNINQDTNWLVAYLIDCLSQEKGAK